MNRALKGLYSLATELEAGGVTRTADDIRKVADDLRNTAGARLQFEGAGLNLAIERLTRIRARLRHGQLTVPADVLRGLLDALVLLKGSAP